MNAARPIKSLNVMLDYSSSDIQRNEERMKSTLICGIVLLSSSRTEERNGTKIQLQDSRIVQKESDREHTCCTIGIAEHHSSRKKLEHLCSVSPWK
jgi:hypothetical protein